MDGKQLNLKLILVTINVPTVLREYRALDPDVEFIVVGGRHTPHTAVIELAHELGNTTYLPPAYQERIAPELSRVTGWNTIARRNFAMLEAIRRGADVIVTIDDDNYPADDQFFAFLRYIFGNPGAGYGQALGIDTEAGIRMFNPGSYAREPYFARGFPYTSRQVKNARTARGPVVWKDAPLPPVGIVTGRILEDPDINGTERLENNPIVSAYDRLTDREPDYVVLDPRETWMPINTQNTAYHVSMAPMMGLVREFGRYDDIWANYLAQRVMMESDRVAVFGDPTVRQIRNRHNLVTNLQEEMLGMGQTEAFCHQLLGITDVNSDWSPLANMDTVLARIARAGHFDTLEAYRRAWVDAVLQALSESGRSEIAPHWTGVLQ